MDRIVTGDKTEEEVNEDNIRPQRLDEYVGQSEVKENIKIFIEAATSRRSLHHCGGGNCHDSGLQSDGSGYYFCVRPDLQQG